MNKFSLELPLRCPRFMPPHPARSTPQAAAKSASKVAAKAASKNVAKKPVKTRQRVRVETRAQMLERLTNPEISLHEASVILRKCTATVRSYCDAGYLPHLRTSGGQRRFLLRDVLAFLREREAEKRRS